MRERSGFFRTLRETQLPLSVRDYFAQLPVLQTPRLILRPVTMRDAQDIFDYSRDPEVARYVLWDAHRSLADSRAYVRYLLRQYRDSQPSSYAIVLRETGRVVGTIGFMSYTEDNAAAEIGYSMARSLWGRGLMPEAVTALLDLGFRRMHLHRIEAQHVPGNPASGRVMLKAGMRHEGTLRGRVFIKGKFSDVELYAILREDWEQRHPDRRTIT